MEAPELIPLPIACTLGPTELRDRRGEWEVLLARGKGRVEATAAGVRIVMCADDAVAAEARRLAALESECCAFARWSVVAGDDVTILDVESDGDGVTAVRAMFAETL